MMNTSNISVLKKIYKLYDSVAKDWPTACRRYCAACCTCNVTMTTLEGALLFKEMAREENRYLMDRVKAASQNQRFIPQITFNRMAQMCIQGKTPPDEESDPRWGDCAILTDSQCPLYASRPFGCRCFVSQTDCQDNGFADVDPFVISVNNVFLQFIEHIDVNGFFGNMVDILVFIESSRLNQGPANAPQQAAAHLAPNQALEMLLVPPEHQAKMKPIVNALLQIQGEYA